MILAIMNIYKRTTVPHRHPMAASLPPSPAHEQHNVLLTTRRVRLTQYRDELAARRRRNRNNKAHQHRGTRPPVDEAHPRDTRLKVSADHGEIAAYSFYKSPRMKEKMVTAVLVRSIPIQRNNRIAGQ